MNTRRLGFWISRQTQDSNFSLDKGYFAPPATRAQYRASNIGVHYPLSIMIYRSRAYADRVNNHTFRPLAKFFWQHVVRNVWFQVSVFRFQDFATRLPDTRNLTPETYINYRCASCPSRVTFFQPSLGKSLVPIYSNLIMFAKDFSNKIFSGLSGLGFSMLQHTGGCTKD